MEFEGIGVKSRNLTNHKLQEAGISPVVEGSAAGNRQFAGPAEAGAEGTRPAGRAWRMLAAEVAAVGRGTAPVAANRAGSEGAAVRWTAGRGTESGTADAEAGPAAGSREAGRTAAAAAGSAAAADMRPGHGGSGMEAAGNKAAAAAGDGDFAGCSMESGPADHIHWGLAVHKVESVRKDTTL